jgi:predicted Ser/Thr protein kinase
MPTPVAPREPSELEHLLVLEAGSNSLKLYVVDPAAGEHSTEVHKFSWSVAHEFFSTGSVSPAVFETICGCLRQAAAAAAPVPIASALAIATGVFREIEGVEQLFARVRAETGVRLRLISGTDEARLMARGLRELPAELPALLCDLGGATLEWMWLRRDRPPTFGSLPLGAIRNQYRLAPFLAAPDEYLRESDAFCDVQLDRLPVEGRVHVMFTGGTTETLAQLLGHEQIAAVELDAMIDRVLREGPPPDIKTARKPVLLPGLCIVRRVVARFGQGGFRHGDAAVRGGMIQRLLELLDHVAHADLHATMLLRTRDGRDLMSAVLADALELTPGAKLGRYEVVAKLGRGAMGVVYRARDPELGRELALKVMRASGDAGERLLGEAQALAQVNHPNVVTVHDVGRVGDDVFVAMELLEGVTLSTWCQLAPRTRDELLAVFIAAGRGLAATHDKKLVQRDFKPDNVLVGHDGRVCLVDFGLARFDDDEGVLATGMAHASTESGVGTGLAGTPAYMAPEQFAHAAVDARTDQFSFCVALWEALYGQPPFAGSSLGQLAAAVMSGAITAPPARVLLPPRRHGALLRGLATDPGDRFASMAELLAALAPAPAKPRRLVAPAVIAVSLAVAAVAGWAMLREREATPDPCAGAEQRLAGVWDDEVRSGMREAFEQTGLPYAGVTFERTQTILDGYAAGWVVMATDACEATKVRQQQSQALLDARNACLDERLASLRTLTRELSGTLDASDLDKAVHRAFELPHVEDCHEVGVANPAAPGELEACGRAPAGHYYPLEVGRTWVYDVVDPSTQLPRNAEPTVVRVEALEQVGGCKGDVLAYRLRETSGPGYALRWIGVEPVESPAGHPPGQITWRYRDQYFTTDGVARLHEYFEPARMRLDESCAHTIARASYVDAYEEITVDPSSECGAELSRRAKHFDWQVVARDVPLRLELDYAHPACCPVPERCGPPPDGPGHRCVAVEGRPGAWTCDFSTLEVSRSEVRGGKNVTYWFAAGVGEVKEHSKGESIETLVCFSLPDDPTP